jgi:hypothetical protein
VGRSWMIAEYRREAYVLVSERVEGRVPPMAIVAIALPAPERCERALSCDSEAPGEMALNIASVGCEWLQDDRIDDIEFQSSATLLGRDVVLLDIVGKDLTLASEEYRGAPSLNSSDSARLEADSARRKTELSMLLDRGSTLVVFVPAPHHWFVDTGERTYSGTGRSRTTTNIVAPRQLAALFPFPLQTEKAESNALELVGGDPFAAFWRRIEGRMSCGAFMKSPLGTTTLRIRNTDCAVASIANVRAGAVIALPRDLEEELEDSVFVDALIELVRAVRNDGGDFSQPEWATSFIIGAEGALSTGVDEAQRRVEDALLQADAARGSLQLLQRRKLLITGSGKALEAVVHDALEALGFVVAEGAPGRTDRIATHPQFGPAVIEVKGKSKSAAEKDSAQLEKWVAAYLEEHDAKAKPILVVNAWRELRLDERSEPAFPDQMLRYAQAREHCLVTGAQLLCAWLEVEQAPERAADVVADLLAASGRWPRYEDWRSWITVAAPAILEANATTDSN